MKEYYDRLSQLAFDMDKLYSNPKYTEEDLDLVDQVKLKLSDTLRTMRELIEPDELSKD